MFGPNYKQDSFRHVFPFQAPEGGEGPEKLAIEDEGGEEIKIPMDQYCTDDYDQYAEGKSNIFICIITMNTEQ